VQIADLSSRRFVEKNICYHGEGRQEFEARNHSGRNTKVDCETQTEGNSRQRDFSNADEQETARKLENKNGKLSVLVDEYERKIVLLNEEMEHMLRDPTSHIHRMKERYEEENQHQMLKMRDMRDELLWYKKQLPVARTSDEIISLRESRPH
jgi:hypothetical protein